MKPTLPDALDRIEAAHGKPPRALPKRALDWVLWENCAYLVSDERRRKAYQELRARTGLLPAGILALSREELREIAALGGMHPDLRVRKLIAIAESVQTTFGGDLGRALKLPLAQARRALKTFPGIGAPGADKILLFTRTHALPALESNGLRTLVRLGHAKQGNSYAATYRAAICALEPYVDRGAAWLIRAHWLLRMHGRVLCKHKGPLCDACTLQENCPSAE